MDSRLLAQRSFPDQFQAALAATATSTGTPAPGAREGGLPASGATPVATTADETPYNAGYVMDRGFIAAGGVALVILILVLLFAVVVTSRHHEHE